MRILLSADHRYPAAASAGVGRRPKRMPSAAGHRIHDLIAKGLCERGHEVFYLLPLGVDAPLPQGVTLVSRLCADVDLYHNMTFREEDLVRHAAALGVPCLRTCHLDPAVQGRERPRAGDNWIFVSRFLARSFGRERVVHNGVDPAAYAYSSVKDDYLLFMAGMDWSTAKGLDTALDLSRSVGFRLVVAGTARDPAAIARVDEQCRAAGACYVGDVQGTRKAELLAGARALLFPTRLDESFGLVVVEALISGTPVIASDRGACPEILSPDVGFVCSSRRDYLDAIDRIAEVDPRRCREKALHDFHYLRMADGYLDQYRDELGANAAPGP